MLLQVTVNGGLGLTLWFSEQVGLSWTSSYKYSFDSREDATVNPNSHATLLQV